METYYLIDFENVNESGLLCPSLLSKHDHIHLFSTENVPKISIEVLSSFNAADFCSHIVPAGKQSLDMHLVAYLGYLLGINSRAECKYVIISKDSGYDKVIPFLKAQTAAGITRQNGFVSPDRVVQNAAPKSLVAKNINKNTNKIKTGAAAAAEKTPNNEIARLLSKAGYGSDVTSYVTALVARQHNKQSAKQNIYRAIVAKYGQKRGLDIYSRVKKNI